jgi:diaminohydroxyphosphoribosylaminopyrimidine deaminase / 5-amino-6-(5-phosphoribosylamino)uracil reductase
MFDGEAPALVATTGRASRARRSQWEAAGAEVELVEPDPAGNVFLPALLAMLGKRDVQGVLLEGGPTLAWSALRDGLVDRVVWYVAPVLVGGVEAPAALGGAGFASIQEALRLDLGPVRRLGDDLRLEADVHRDR